MLQAEADPLCDTAPQTKGVTSANVEGSTAGETTALLHEGLHPSLMYVSVPVLTVLFGC